MLYLNKYLLPGEAAKMLHVTPKTVARYHKEGLLKAHRTLGGHRRYELESILTLMEAPQWKSL